MNTSPPELQFLAPQSLTSLHVFYDGHCALCGAIRNWLARQPALVEIALIPHQSPRAWEIFPPLRRLDRDQDIIILTNTGYTYQGAEALVACLESLTHYRRLATFLARPRPLRLFSQCWHAVSSIRHLLFSLGRLLPLPKSCPFYRFRIGYFTGARPKHDSLTHDDFPPETLRPLAIQTLPH